MDSIIFAFIILCLITIGYLMCDLRYQVKYLKYGDKYNASKAYNVILDDLCNATIRSIRENEEHLFSKDDIIETINEFRDQHKIKL